MASTLYETNGAVREITPHGATWALEELQGIVGGYIEVVRTIDDRFMVINEMGKAQDPPLDPNMNATLLYKHGDNDYIAGPAVVVDTKLELDGPDEEGEDLH